jgi:alanyl-tRNA synthetase
MSSYYPFGEKIVPTEEEIEKERLMFKQYDYYGIPYGLIDDSAYGEGNRTDIEEDQDAARMFILKGEPVPKDLETRLLKYKEQCEKLNKKCKV